MCRCTTKQAKLNVPSEDWSVCPVQSVFAVGFMVAKDPNFLQTGSEDWDAQADLSLFGAQVILFVL